MRAFKVARFGALMGLATIGVAHAHGADDTPDGVSVMTDPAVPDTVTDGLLPPSLGKEARGPARAVVDAMKLWAPGATLAVCFLEEATPIVRKRVIDAANEWAKATNLNLHFDFGDAAGPQTCDKQKPHQISISFKGDSSSSYNGIESKDHEPSMVLGNLNDETTRISHDDREFRRIVLHEFGHAVGLEHENQSPEAKCSDQINWEKAEKYYAEKLHWSKQTVHDNLATMMVPMRAAKDALGISGYDKQSIMQYSMPAEIFKDGSSASCHTTINYDLSDTDKKWVGALYSDNPDVQARIKRAMVNTADKVLKDGGVPDEERKAAIAKIGATFGITVNQTNNGGSGNVATGVNNGSIVTNTTTNNAPTITQNSSGANSPNIGKIDGGATFNFGPPPK